MNLSELMQASLLWLNLQGYAEEEKISEDRLLSLLKVILEAQGAPEPKFINNQSLYGAKTNGS